MQNFTLVFLCFVRKNGEIENQVKKSCKNEKKGWQYACFGCLSLHLAQKISCGAVNATKVTCLNPACSSHSRK